MIKRFFCLWNNRMEHGNNLDRTALVFDGRYEAAGIYKYLDALYLWFCSFSGTYTRYYKTMEVANQRSYLGGNYLGIEYTSGLVLTNILEPLPGSTPDRLQWTILWGWIMHLRGLLQDWYWENSWGSWYL